MGLSKLRNSIEGSDVASQDVGKPSDQQIAHRMARQRPVPTEAVLEGVFPHAPVIIIAG